jgi:hypothetical protein
MRTRTIAAFIILAAAAGAPGGITITPLLVQRDELSGVGLVTRIDNLAVNDVGDWLVEADTDHADANFDQVLVRNGDLYLREGDPLALPVGASISSFDSININSAGDSGWNLFLDGTGGTTNDSGIYFNTNLLIQEGTISGAAGFTPGTPYIGFFDVKINNDNALMSVLSIDDPAIATTVDRALMRIVLDGNGALVSENVVYKEGDIPPGQTQAIADFGTGPHASAFNDAGTMLYVVDLTGDTATDGVIYRGDEIIAQEGGPSPIEGRNWLSVGSARLDINAAGGYVHTGQLAGDTNTDQVIIRNGAKFIQEGDTLPAIGGSFLFTGFGSGPVWISDENDVLWFGDWNDADTTRDTGLFLNDQLLVQEGVTQINGLIVQSLAGVESGYAMSDSGRYIIFEATLTDGTLTYNGAFLIDREGDCGAYVRADSDGDGNVNNFDIDAFVLALSEPAAYLATYCNGDEQCRQCRNDIDGDGNVNNFDIDPFVQCLTSGCP